ncbi:type I restriction-modification system subunit M N-terminal domain-containing protein [Lachnospiraceae bacterium CLA-AA-H58]|uniref:type I restriction-modification system subunit M N-terminal domain-containing protein n=1 Tax=Pilosibacter fragilis TaxID=3078042 RepID=UPI0032D4C5D2
MNKHQLASTIWESANQMRSKIEANEYKDFILGLGQFTRNYTQTTKRGLLTTNKG